MLVDEQRCGECGCDREEGRELGGLLARDDEQDQRGEVERTRDPDRGFPTELRWDRVVLCGAVVVEVLEGVDDVESCDPEEDHQRDGEHGGGGWEHAWVDGDHGGDGGRGEGASQEDVAEECESFGEGVEPDPCEDGGCELGGDPVVVEESESGGGDDEGECGYCQQEEAVSFGERAAREGAAFGSFVFCVEVRISDAVDEHGPCACEDHAEDDECEHAGEGGVVYLAVLGARRDEEGAENREGQREDGVCELDVRERDGDPLGPGEGSGRRVGVDGGHGRGVFVCGVVICGF